jgi:tRNA nucleotidyltransferase (CCA-adding enzyme)
MDKQGKLNLSSTINEQLSTGIIAFLKMVGVIAEKRGMQLYLVGGVVRDLLLERLNTDLDMVVEGDGIKLAEEIGALIHAKITTHTRFGTATIKWEKRSADFATARTEIYPRPGALPKVKFSTIKDDLSRRDFTINAMAVAISPTRFGELIDPFDGRTDLEKNRVCVLHDQSFTDDATRIWRAIRYEQRLDFRIEPVTTLLIKRDLDMLKTVSGDRIRHELELVLKEEEPEKALRRADELGVLEMLNPHLKADAWLADRFAAAREYHKMDIPSPYVYMSLLCYRLKEAEAEKLISYLRLPKAAAGAIRDTMAIKENIKELSLDGQSPSIIYKILRGYSPASFEANVIVSGSAPAAENIELYERVLKHVHPALTGDDLKKLGIPRGPKIKETLQKLLEAKLDGLAETKEDEEKRVKERKLA